MTVLQVYVFEVALYAMFLNPCYDIHVKAQAVLYCIIVSLFITQ